MGRGRDRLEVGPTAGDDVHHAVGEAGLGEQLAEDSDGERILGAGFTTTVLPIASAGPTLPAMLTIGKLYGVMHCDHTDRLAEDGRADEPAGGQRGRRHLRGR